MQIKMVRVFFLLLAACSMTPAAVSASSPRGASMMLVESPKPTNFAEAHQIYSRSKSIGMYTRSRAGIRSSLLTPVLLNSPPSSSNSYRFTATPEEYGGDPTGSMDSTAAVKAAVEALLNRTASSIPPMASGIVNVGGASLDLAGGAYLISQPVQVPSYVGNFHIGGGGTLLASKTFPEDKYLIEIGSKETCQPKDNQKVCNEYITVSDIFLDAAHTSAGGIHVVMTMGTTVTNSFVTGFNRVGILIDQGHETMVSECWVAEYYWSENHPKEECSSSSGSVGILINGQDNIVSDVIIFDFTCLGVRVNGAANLLHGVHSWNGGGTAISVNGSYDIQDRVIDCYLDYSTLEIVQPRYVLVQGNFFYNAHTTLVPSSGGDQPVAWLTMKDNIYSLNQYGGNKSVVVPMGTKCMLVDIVDEINANQGKRDSSTVLQTRLKRSIQLDGRSGGQTEYVFNFANRLIFGNIDWVSYTLVQNDGYESIVSHVAHRVNGTAIKVVLSRPVAGTLYMEVAECTNS